MTDREYTTQQKVDDFLGKATGVSLTDYILSAQEYIEGFTGRVFKACGTASARLFDVTRKAKIILFSFQICLDA